MITPFSPIYDGGGSNIEYFFIMKHNYSSSCYSFHVFQVSAHATAVNTYSSLRCASCALNESYFIQVMNPIGIYDLSVRRFCFFFEILTFRVAGDAWDWVRPIGYSVGAFITEWKRTKPVDRWILMARRRVWRPEEAAARALWQRIRLWTWHHLYGFRCRYDCFEALLYYVCVLWIN